MAQGKGKEDRKVRDDLAVYVISLILLILFAAAIRMMNVEAQKHQNQIRKLRYERSQLFQLLSECQEKERKAKR